MDCTDCCKAADFDSSFFIIDPRGAVQTTLDPTTPGTSIIMTKMTHRLVDEQDQRPNLRAPNRQGGRLKPYDGRPSEVYGQWIEGWTIQEIPNNLVRNKTPCINFPKRLYVTQSQAIKGWLTDRKGMADKGHEGLLGLQDKINAQTLKATIRGNRRIQPTRVMDSYSHSDSLQLTGMSRPGEGWLRVRAATEEEDDPKAILKKRKKMPAQINEEEKSRDRPGQATSSVRSEHTMAGRLETPTLNDITVRNAICRELELTPLESVSHGTSVCCSLSSGSGE